MASAVYDWDLIGGGTETSSVTTAATTRSGRATTATAALLASPVSMNIEIDNDRKSKSRSMAKINEGLSDSEAAKLEVKCMVYYEDKWNPSMCETLNIRVAGDSARSVHKRNIFRLFLSVG